MPDTFTCPRCFRTAPIRPGARFCPHCGLANAQEAAADTSPLEINAGGRAYRVMDRIAIGSICTIYRCRFTTPADDVEGVFKIAGDAQSNALVANEAAKLRALLARDTGGQFAPFLPVVEASVAVGEGSVNSPVRQANILRMHPAICSPDELYTLFEVKNRYPGGLDSRNVAWIWRRLLSILGFVHAHGIVHGAVLPMHVMIEPREHKLVLIDWCGATDISAAGASPLKIIAGGHVAWYKRESASTHPPTPALDIAFAARCMIELLGGDPVEGVCPPTVEPAFQRHLQRCIMATPNARPNAMKILADFDKLLEPMWGPRKFRKLELD